ncbi:MAG: sulfite exporter TauE/SafE family protein [Myxococcota bacterium]|nr:sulfite exporter TauE/SafE family protein [Myxococcota bacterium]
MPPLSLSPLETALAFAVMLLAACVQGSVGFGMALIAAPVLALLDPRFVPGPVMLVGMCLTGMVLIRERRSIDLGGLRYALPGSFLGTAAGGALLGALSPRGFGLLFSGLVLLAVLLSAAGWHVRATPGKVLGAGLLGGFMGTTSSIGGPPMALVYQDASAARLRGTLAAYFICTNAMGLTTLAVIGRLGRPELERAGLLLPGLVLGFVTSLWTARWLDGASARPLVLGLSGLAALVLLARVLLAGGG